MEELLNDSELLLSQGIISSIINEVNEIGILIQNLNSQLKLNANSKDNISLLNTIRTGSKAITLKLMSLLLPLSNKALELPDKLFDSLSFLSIKYLDIVVSYNEILDQTPIADIMKGLFLFYSKSGADSSQFLEKKSKYISMILQLIYSQIDNGSFDLKEHFNQLIDFAIFIQMNSSFERRLSYMPGIVSKLVKVVTVLELKLSSMLIKKMLWILNDFLSIVLHYLQKEDNNRLQFLNFFFCFMDALRSRYSSRLPKLLNELIETNLKILNEVKKQGQFITVNQFDSMFNLLNCSLVNLDSNSESKGSRDLFYSACSSYLSQEDCGKRIAEEVREMKSAYSRKESERFNRSSYVLSGLLLIYINYCKKCPIEVWETTNEEAIPDTLSTLLNLPSIASSSTTIKDIFNQIYSLFESIIMCNSKIIYEVVNQYEVSIQKVSIEDCEKKLSDILLRHIIYSNELNFNLFLLRSILHSQLYRNSNQAASYLINKSFQSLFNTTREFISSLSKQNLTRKQLNSSLAQTLDSLALFIYLAHTSFTNQLNLKASSQYKAIISFFSSYLCDNDTIEALEKAKISTTQLTLINFFTLSLCICGISSSISFNKQEKNSLIMLSMLNYSSRLSLLKYSATWLIFLLSHDKDVKQFIVDNFNLIINTILNKVIYFSADLSNVKVNIFNFFTSLIELIRDIDNEAMSNFYCSEFVKYIQYMFPYIDSNMKIKAFAVLEIILEVILKITWYQKEIIVKLFKEFEVKMPDDASKMALENNNTEYFAAFLKGKFDNELSSNVFRQCILRITPLILSGQIKLVSKCIGVISNLIPLLHLLPMKREENENFSAEDPNNVIINSSLGPVMHEIWKEIVYALECQGKRKDATTISDFKLFYALFDQVLTYHPRFYSYERMHENLIPAVKKVFSNFEKIYTVNQYAKAVTDFVFEFVSKASFVNHYGQRARTVIAEFIERYKECYILCNQTNIDDNIRILLSYYG